MPHNSPRKQQIAEDGLILKTEAGSGLHGVTIPGTDDMDIMGICIEPPECVLGLEQFEQYISRTREDGTEIPEGQRSGHGDTDLVVYSLRKYARLAAQGNPTVLMPLFAPPESVYFTDRAGASQSFGKLLLRDRGMFLSREAGKRFLGYAAGQHSRFLESRVGHTNRPELIEKYGYDCYSDDTDFLTLRGWLTYDKVTQDDHLATINPQTGAIEYQQYSRRYEDTYDGKILRHNSNFCNWRVTPNHRMLVSKMLRGPGGTNPRAYSEKTSGGWGFLRAEEVKQLDWYQRITPKPKDEDNPEFSDSFLSLVGAYVSEGSVAKRRKDGTVSVLSLAQRAYGRLFPIVDIIGAGYPVRRYDYARADKDGEYYSTFTICHPDADKIAKGCAEGSYFKQLPNWIHTLSARQADVLLDAMMAGDGTPAVGTEGWVYNTQSPGLADDVQTLALIAGRPSVRRGEYLPHGMHQVLVKPRQEFASFRGRDIVEDNFTGRIVCFSVPNETLVTRRRGKVAMHGNSKAIYHALRLVIQGEELMRTGTITLPMETHARSFLLDVRGGLYTREVLQELHRHGMEQLRESIESSDLPEKPDFELINDWLAEVHMWWWQKTDRWSDWDYAQCFGSAAVPA